MTPDEHYQAAEAHLSAAEKNLRVSGNLLTAAGVHALLALASVEAPPLDETMRPRRPA